jgi:hypothetical protein
MAGGPHRDEERVTGSLFVVENVGMTVEMYFIIDRTDIIIREVLLVRTALYG